MKKLLFLLVVSATIFSCRVTFMPTKSPTALGMVQQIQIDANTAFYMPMYDYDAYQKVSDEIDLLTAFDKSRAKSGNLVSQDKRIKSLFDAFNSEHKAKSTIVSSEQETYEKYFKSVIDARVVAENSLK